MLAASLGYRQDLEESDQTLRLRPIESCHIAALISLGHDTGLSPWSSNCYLEELKNPTSIMLRAVGDENRLMGFIVGRLVPASDKEREYDAEIYNIAVGLRAQRKGTGDKLFRAFVDICSEHGVAHIWLEVRESNSRAIAFYQNRGFVTVQNRPNFYNDPSESALAMRLSLLKHEA